MSTIRPFLASGVRLGVVPENHSSDLKTEEEQAMPDMSVELELEGSCELISGVESETQDDNEDETSKNEYAQRRRRIIKRWLDSRAIDSDDN